MMQSSKGAMTFTVMQDSLPMRRRFVIQGLRRGGLVAVGLMGLLVGPGVVRAEGGCPAGQYPIGGQGVQGCAPIPANAAPPSAPRPNGRWIETWGAIAVASSGVGGAAKGLKTRKDAVEAALKDCAAAGDTDCKVMTVFRNQCVASIYAGPGLVSRTFTGPTIEVARDAATKDCRQRAPNGECRIIYTACSEPLFEPF